MKTIPLRIFIPLVAVAMTVALYGIARADSISFGASFWVTSNWSSTTSTTFGAKASSNDGITCPNGSVQTGWRIIYTGYSDAYGPEGSGGSYDSYEYGTQCRQPSSAVTTGARTWVTSNWSNSTTPTFGAKASNDDGITCPGSSVQTGWRIVAIDPGMGVYEYGTQCQPLVSSVTLGTPYWVTSNSSGGTMPFGAGSPKNNGITCPNGSVQTGWRIIYTGYSDAYGPEGSGGSYDSYEYGTQCRSISAAPVEPPPSSCNVIQSYTTPGTFDPPAGTYTLQVIGGGGGGAGSSSGQNQNVGGIGGRGANTSVTGPFGTVTASGGAGGSNSNFLGTSGVAGETVAQSVTFQSGSQFVVTIGGGGGGGGGGGISGSGPAGGNGSAGAPALGGAGGIGAAVCGWQGNAHSGPAGSGGSGGVSSGGGGGAGSSGDNGNYGCAAGDVGLAGTLSAGGAGGLNGGYARWTSTPAAGGTAPGGGGGATGAGGGGGGGARGVVRICSNTSAISCTVTFDQNPLTGSATTMRWTSTGLGPTSTFYIKQVGYVGASGSAQVSQTGDYSGTLKNAAGQVIGSCSAALSSPNSCNNSTLTCNPTTGNLTDSCGNTTTCPYGCSTQTNKCNTTCQPRNVCNASGTKVVNICGGAVVKDCSRTGQLCVASQCISPPIGFEEFDATNISGNTFRATGHLQVAPSLVKKGDTTRVFWNVAHAASCTVLGSNGDGALGSGTGIWDIPFSGTTGKTTSAIKAKTTYTLLCRALDGVSPPSVQETATVNVLPSFQEL